LIGNTRESAAGAHRTDGRTVPTVEQIYLRSGPPLKIELLTRLIDFHDFKLGIVFCNTKNMVDELVDHLNAQGYSADRLHGDMNQAMRDTVMNKFRKSAWNFWSPPTWPRAASTWTT
jgi:ATP-dependent RNA helicase DeaD